MTDVRPPESHLDLLERPLFAHLATVAKDCSPRVNPMWFYWDTQAGVLKLTHTNQRHNYRNLQQNPRVAVARGPHARPKTAAPAADVVAEDPGRVLDVVPGPGLLPMGHQFSVIPVRVSVTLLVSVLRPILAL